MRTFRDDLKRAVAFHGHLCSGQCIGVRMAQLGMKTLGLDNETDDKAIMVWVECDRCPADSIMITTGCHPGKRTYRMLDYGKIAATFVNLETGGAVRVRRHTRRFPAEGEDLVEFYESLPDEEFLTVEEIELDIRPCDLPGKPLESVVCEKCGEDISDFRHIVRDGCIFCKACAEGAYYRSI